MQEVKNRMSKITKRGIAILSLKEPAASRCIVDFPPENPESDSSFPEKRMWKFDDRTQLSLDELLTAARDAGIVDELDGEPLADKLERAARAVRATSFRQPASVYMIIDATEHEHYGSAAWAVLREFPKETARGLTFAARACGCDIANTGFLVRMTRKERFTLHVKTNLKVLKSRSMYPSYRNYNDRLEIRFGVQACLALYYAVEFGDPQRSMVVTVAGDSVANSQNVRVPVDTHIRDVLRFCGLITDPNYVIVGDSMTGTCCTDDHTPVTPGMSCLLAMKFRPHVKKHRSCIGCGRCISACHANLLPFEIARRVDNMQYERLPRLLPQDCDNCGACSYICPAGIDVATKVFEARQNSSTVLLKWGDDIVL